ncbi:MAG: AmmeMemoRadiSam system protein A [Candidatus Scalindua sp. AMX11]|nr:MAG: AmmeMemoRadiSam system protein A [Candidatus Scalindua sp.]NOG85093.1 AmmeMemoRadiSam system protein A [Planctomycetota bacterium]RZV69324.1 MAG: AmmeMemoRadiSam system protein A [Candidatus Scalindua sp. SCAELEC01]TDE66765.1 MAG: AmmeMemoRadiSam system protein A [Candidatus Scalindua sp. AMX11]GJQ60381.1 MAG: AmmeMemoRadiSam system protein A [Candidatus Scalindua sp.]
MNSDEKGVLLDIARNSIKAAIQGIPIDLTHFQVNAQESNKEHGVFVTLRTAGKLRGCIGQLVSRKPLGELVSEMAVSAALEDTRFEKNRIAINELDDLEIEISLLSPLQRIANPLEFELARHGVYIKRGRKNGCFLPQVASETGWSKEEFLTQCCQGKAGLPPDAWKDKATEVYVFTVDIIS